MAMPDTARRYTVDEVLAFPPDGNRYELVDGALLVTPAPRVRHQVVLSRLLERLSRYLELRDDLQALLSPADIRWPDEVLVQPDLFVAPVAELTAEDWSSVRTLVLAVEVVSPSSSRYDRVTKRRVYQAHGVATYWVVDPDARLVEVWTPGDSRPEIVTDVLRWRVGEASDELAIGLADLFAGPPPPPPSPTP